MTRNEIDKEYKWDLSDLFINDEAWQKAFDEIELLAQDLNHHKGHLLDSADMLLKGIEAHDLIDRKLTNIVTYSRLKLDENTKASKYQMMSSQAESLVAKVGALTAFFAPELMQGDLETVTKLMRENEGLKIYRQFFEDLYRNQPHILDEKIENILVQTEEIGATAANAYGMLLNADMTFEPAVDKIGNSHPLSNGTYVPLMMSSDRALRKDTMKKYYASYSAHINTIATLMQSEVKKNIFFAKTRHFESARQAALFSNNVPVAVPDALIEAVHEKLPAFHHYMKIRKKALGLDEMHLYDIYNPIVDDIEYKVPYKEAQTTVVEALKPLGDDYVGTLKEAYQQRWIDVYETEGKRSGAYSWGTYDSRPYVLLNYKDNVDSMFTLAHELGHSMHSYLTHQHQPFVYGNYSIFVAEVASTTNEALLNHYLMETLEDDKKKKYILNHYLEQFRGTIFRQTMFAEFERDIHAHVEAGGALTAEYMCNHYLELNKLYFGDDVVIDNLIKYEWARIPHMYYNFYVYQYATGFSAAVAFADKIVNEGQEAVNAYLEFLSSGSSDYPIHILRKAGVDMEKAQTVEHALNVFEASVKAFEKLL